MKTDHYRHIAKYVEVAKTKEQLAYAMAQINAHCDKVSIYGKQLYRNNKLSDLGEIETPIKQKMIQLGITDTFVWAGVKVYVTGNEITIGLE